MPLLSFVALVFSPSFALRGLASEGKQDASETIVLKGAKIVTMSAAEIENGMVVIEGGRIRRVGTDLDVPAGAKVIELAKTAQVLPGFIDLHSHLGSAFEVEEPTEAVTPHVRAVEAFTSREWERSAYGFRCCLQIRPAEPGAARYLEVIESYRETPPPDDWNMGIELTEK